MLIHGGWESKKERPRVGEQRVGMCENAQCQNSERCDNTGVDSTSNTGVRSQVKYLNTSYVIMDTIQKEAEARGGRITLEDIHQRFCTELQQMSHIGSGVVADACQS